MPTNADLQASMRTALPAAAAELRRTINLLTVAIAGITDRPGYRERVAGCAAAVTVATLHLAAVIAPLLAGPVGQPMPQRTAKASDKHAADAKGARMRAARAAIDPWATALPAQDRVAAAAPHSATAGGSPGSRSAP